ncbi:hypothetical protein COR50_01805 [Chitinophaga caeni]|uniref:Uncharacterized protein n=1 Tax=Chitinophaga caeni TaxID=2029983 RepID=A0A291QPY5_9BACT|nr:hypothetical protein COR50_01805 [Chitinophaga caeni]
MDREICLFCIYCNFLALKLTVSPQNNRRHNNRAIKFWLMIRPFKACCTLAKNELHNKKM